ncbi:MAG: hypothetical protein IPH05_12560 [Flavobacteriales bacterium]|nr:hypothetical protein [Flavobacteriales bacterium]
MAGYPAGASIQGTGVVYRRKYQLSDLEVTAGSFSEQFGQGLIFRSYGRYLGVDNVDGVRVKYKPYRGVPQNRSRPATLRATQRLKAFGLSAGWMPK